MGSGSIATCGLCQDSPLSTAASITGIITFVYAVFVGTLLYLKTGAEAVATSLEDLVKILDEVGTVFETIAMVNIDEVTTPLDLITSIQQLRVEAFRYLKSVAKWLGYPSDLLPFLDRFSERFNWCGERITDTDVMEAARLLARLKSYHIQTQWCLNISGTKYRLPIYRGWLRWTIRLRWNQKPLKVALIRFGETLAGTKEIKHAAEQAQQQRRLEDNIRQLFAKLDEIAKEQRRLEEPMGETRGSATSLEGADPLESLMRPAQSFPRRSTFSLAREAALPDSESMASNEGVRR